MKVLITGTRGLAQGIANSHIIRNDEVAALTRDQNNIHNVEQWANEYQDYDILYNCAYDGIAQVKVLTAFANLWKENPNKTIISIGSMVTDYPRSEIEKDHEFWQYRYDKRMLQDAIKDLRNDCKCDLRLYNPGPIDTDIVKHLTVKKYNPNDLANYIISLNKIPGLKRADLWL